ncbi:OadG family protein [Melioribacter sp. OK-6-Me]|uniref:OadG family protein n=1 Tax=unclassified Melioribacter TaxID=2627329 RepID=UPI003EDAD475
MFLLAFQNSAIDTLTRSRIEQNAEKFSQLDAFGIGLTFIGMSVVFASLLLLYIVFYNLTKLINNRIKKKQTPSTVKTESYELSGEVNAAISTAIFLYLNELHDKENMVLTINRVARIYSPWSSKIYGLRHYPRSRG